MFYNLLNKYVAYFRDINKNYIFKCSDILKITIHKREW